MARMSPVRELDPAHPGNVFKERDGSYVVGSVVFAVVDEGRDGDVGQAWDAGPAQQRASGCQRRWTVPTRGEICVSFRAW